MSDVFFMDDLPPLLEDLQSGTGKKYDNFILCKI